MSNGNTPALRLRRIASRLEDTLFQLHSHMRDVDGLHAPEAVDELCKLLFLKVLDQKTTPPGSPFSLQGPAYGSAQEFAACARRLFRRALLAEEKRLEASSGELCSVWGELGLSDAALVRCLDQLSITRSAAAP